MTNRSLVSPSLARPLALAAALLLTAGCSDDPVGATDTTQNQLDSTSSDLADLERAHSSAPANPHGAGHGNTLPGLAEALQNYEPIVLPLSGRVQGPDGEPIERFEVVLRSVVRPRDPDPESWPTVDGTFSSPAGEFSFDALDAPHWTLVVSAEGYAPCLPTPVELTGAEDEPVVVSLERATRVEGRVLTPDGDPVANAQVGTGRLVSFRPYDVGEFTWGFQVATTDDEGRFAFEGLGSGSVDLVARAPEYASSAALRIAPTLDGEREDVELQLRRGAFVEGVATDAGGVIAPGRIVRAFQQHSELYAETIADAEGRFAFDHLEPGDWQLQSLPTGEELAEHGVDPSNSLAMQALMSMAHVELADAQTLRLRLSSVPESPVWFEGRVLRGGAPAAGMLQLAPASRDPLARMVVVSVTEAGGFRARLDAPGTWMAVFYDQTGGSGRRVVELPEQPLYASDIVMPSGEVRGVVLHPSGEPQPGAAVSLVRERPPGGRMPQRHYSEVTETLADGSFSFRGLAAGTYRVIAGLGPGVGQAHLADVRLARGELREGLELQLGPGAGIAGRVVDMDGLPVTGAAIWVRDADGFVLNPTSVHYSDSAGLWRYDGLPAGEYTLSARTRRGASQLSQPVLLSAARLEPVRLVLEPATVLRVRTRGESGERLEAGLVLGDGHGRDWADLRDLKHMWEVFDDGWALGDQRVGPIPPGEYLITATAADGRSSAQWVSVLGEELQTVDLLLVGGD